MILFTSSQVGEVLQRLYDSEINISISSDIMDGFRPSIYTDGRGSLLLMPSKSIMNVVDGLAFSAARDYPNSDFAKWYTTLHHPIDYVVGRDYEGFLIYSGGLPSTTKA